MKDVKLDKNIFSYLVFAFKNFIYFIIILCMVQWRKSIILNSDLVQGFPKNFIRFAFICSRSGTLIFRSFHRLLSSPENMNIKKLKQCLFPLGQDFSGFSEKKTLSNKWHKKCRLKTILGCIHSQRNYSQMVIYGESLILTSIIMIHTSKAFIISKFSV